MTQLPTDPITADAALSQAEQLHRNGFPIAAATMARIALEVHIRGVCAATGLNVRSTSAGVLAAELNRIGVIDSATRNAMTKALKIGNKAAHGLTPTDGQFDRILNGARAVVSLSGEPVAPLGDGKNPLGPFLENYIAGRARLKPNTVRNYRITQNHLLRHFSRERQIESITPGDADEWREAMIAFGLGRATLSREVKRARTFFRAAVRKRLIPGNPFSDLPAPAQVNPKREFFVTREVFAKVLEACDATPRKQGRRQSLPHEKRLLLALCRYGGLRCPSEVFSLRWVDIDWDRQRITVHSPKTEHLPGGDCRVIPLFPELLPFLVESKKHATEDGSEYCIRGDGRSILATPQYARRVLIRALARAGVKPWPKLFANLRASRETELCETFPLHVVVRWIGNSEAIARQHYLQVTESHYHRAIVVKPVNERPCVAEALAVQTHQAASERPLAQAVGVPTRDDALEALAAKMLRADHRLGGFLAIGDLRDAAGLPPVDFDQALAALVAARRVDLYPHDYPGSLTAAEAARMYRAGGATFNGLSLARSFAMA